MGGNTGRRTRRRATAGRGSVIRTAKGYALTAVSDVPDIRDRMYEPSLAPLAPALKPPSGLAILDQGTEGACTGFGLAATINLLHRRQGLTTRVSPRMIYEMARRYDEWKGEDYSGSSCRGAIRGWRHMGVCPDALWPYEADDASSLTLARAKAAQAITLGAYYRLRPEVSEVHAALNEAGVVYCSADVHKGWDAPVKGVIKFHKQVDGGHAFALVGYDTNGFSVQNSWGAGWGRRGLALWTYEDWLENVRDAWVAQLAVPTPQIFGRAPGRGKSGNAGLEERESTPRRDIAGHFVHVDDGRFDEHGKYWSTLDDVRVTAQYVAGAAKYEHVLLYAHGGLNSIDASARRIAAMRDVFKANGIYPFHFMYDTGLLEEIKDVLLGKKKETLDRVGGVLSDVADRAIEFGARRPGRALWREMKRDAERPFDPGLAGSETLRALLPAIVAADNRPARQLHLVGHSTGGVLMGYLLKALSRVAPPVQVASVNLMAPACTVPFYRAYYEPYLTRVPGGLDVRRMTIYNLTDALEQDDTVGIYNKSLLYLVSRSFEEARRQPLLGMQTFSAGLDRSNTRLTIRYSQGTAGGSGARTTSTTHGGFDNDVATMNDILRTVLGAAPRVPFTKEHLDY